MAGEASQPVGRTRKRVSKVVLSEDEEDDAPASRPERRSNSKRPRPTPPEDSDDALALLDSEEDEPEASSRRRLSKGKGKAVSRATTATPSRSQRRRITEDDGELDGEEDAGQDVDGGEGDVRFKPAYQRNTDGYVAGAIVRMRLRNFMTYDDVQFFPGPYLNMILGPNGTGKSSIAAGIAIGLNFPHSVMGRAKKMSQYVKQGCDEAITEVELKGFPGKRNTIIQRTFWKANEQSDWLLNGQAATKKAIADAIKPYGVQADNLCCFLAQDRVAEFSRMGPEDKLTETMRVAGDSRLLKWFEELKRLGVERKKYDANAEKAQAETARLQARVNEMRPDVEHFEEREKLQAERDALQMLKTVGTRRGVMENIVVEKKRLTELAAEREQFRAQRTPINLLRGRYTEKLEKAEVQWKKVTGEMKEAEKAMAGPIHQLRAKASDIEQIDNQIASLKTSKRRDEEQKAIMRKKMADAQKILSAPAEDNREALERLRADTGRLRTALHDAEKVMDSVKAEQTASAERLSYLNRQIDLKSADIQQLESIEGRKIKQACDFDPHIKYAINWLKDHGHEFEKPVILPPMISANLKQRQYADQVESLIPLRVRSSFILQTKQDYDRMLDLNTHRFPPGTFHNGKRLDNVKVKITISHVELKDDSLNPRHEPSHEAIRDMGFECYASDHIEAEAPVIALLNDRVQLHRKPVTTKPNDTIDQNRVQAAGILIWATGDLKVESQRSAYGRRDIQTSTTSTGKAHSLNIAVDVERTRALRDELTTLKREKRDKEESNTSILSKMTEAKEKVEKIRQKLDKLKEDETALRNANQARIRAQSDITRAQSKIAELDKIDYTAQKKTLMEKKVANARTRLQLQTVYFTAEAQYKEISKDLEKVRLNLDQVTTDEQAIARRMAQAEAAAKLCQVEFLAVKARIADLRKLKDTMTEELAAWLAEQGENETFQKFHEFLDRMDPDNKNPDGPELNLDDITRLHLNVEARLELSEGIDPGVIRTFKRLSEELDKSIATQETQQTILQNAQRKIRDIASNFDPALDTLVSAVSKSFSDSFEHVGCAGEVRVHRSEEGFDKWGIEVLVSYRDGDSLDILSGTRQSGGERSLATITYLMALTGMARVPFSLVDEINQGMDQQAERNMHNQLVEATCKPTAGQYFLITPKLLRSLDYHTRMRELIVLNGRQSPVKNREHWTSLKSTIKYYQQSHGLVAAH